jgi:hypothetical protein
MVPRALVAAMVLVAVAMAWADQGGGGGGGYSGGAQGGQGGGGGGGSFVSSAPEVFSLFTEQTAFGTTMESQNGYIEYRFLDYNPIARCR